MTHKQVSSFSSIFLLALLAGCGGGGASSSLNAPVCPDLVEAIKLVAPQDGAKNVPTNIGKLSFSNTSSEFAIRLNGSDGSQISSGEAVLGSTNGGATATVSIPSLSSGVTYSVAVVQSSGSCSVYGQGTLGTFSTQ
jgi:hypothetical protein